MQRRSARPSTFTSRSAAALRRAFAAAVLAGGAAVVLLGRGTAGAAADPEAGSRRSLQQLAADVSLLEKRAALANSDSFYLLLDMQNSRLVLLLRGAVLRDYKYEALEVGEPRVVFRSRHLAGQWQGRIWTAGNLVPAREHDRVEIVPPDSTAAADSTQPFKLPPLPEEAYPVPARYHVRYTGGLSLEVRPQQLDSSVKRTSRMAATFAVWYHDLREAIAKEPEDTIRLRLVLRPEDAASLYRALPPDTHLLILPARS
jgi:hypothetical protein